MKALILVDIQNDFSPTGALPVPQGDEVVPVANRLQKSFDLVVATQDWHPPRHGSFAVTHGRSPGDVIDLNGVQQILWPAHCIRGTKGAAFIPGLHTNSIAQIFRKGMDLEVDSYSGFFDNDHRSATGLGGFLKEQGVTEVYVAGLALDYCVKYTALDARKLEFEVSLVEDGCRAVNLQPGDAGRALEELRTAGVKIVNSGEV